jgi:peptidoglycan-associated lipoprotein
MTLRQVTTLALAGLILVGCKRRTPADVPAPTPVAVSDDDAAARARAAEEERLRAERARQAELARAREALTELIYLDNDSETLTAESQDRLRTKAAILRANPSIRLRVEGHCDERGSTEYNLALGQRRSESVRTFLAGYGIGADRLETISYGKERPLVDGSSEAAWARNRRAEFAITGGEIATIPTEIR